MQSSAADLNSRFFKVINENDDPVALQELVDQGADINAIHESNSALYFAIRSGKKNNIHYLIANRANINRPAQFGRTALMAAAIENDFNTVKMLIDLGADIAVKDVSGQNALMYAAERSDLKMIKLFIEANADVNEVDIAGNTALHFLNDEKEDSLKELVSAGANTNAYNKNGLSPLMKFAKNKKYVDILIERGANRADLFKSGKTELMYCVVWNDFYNAAKLLSYGDDVNARDSLGNTALIYACSENKIDFVKLFLANSAKINDLNDLNKSALLFASNSEILVLLIASGADIDVVSKYQETVLINAVRHNQEDIVKLLLEKNITLGTINVKLRVSYNSGYTALWFACKNAKNKDSDGFYPFVNIASMLLLAGANPHIKCDGYTVLDMFPLGDIKYSPRERLALFDLIYDLDDTRKTLPGGPRNFSFFKSKTTSELTYSKLSIK